MSPRCVVGGLFVGSAICFVIQIVKEAHQLPGEPMDVFWGVLAIKCGLWACLFLAREGCEG